MFLVYFSAVPTYKMITEDHRREKREKAAKVASEERASRNRAIAEARLKQQAMILREEKLTDYRNLRDRYDKLEKMAYANFENSQNLLATAEKEFAERAFNPFWFIIEQTTYTLQDYSAILKNVEKIQNKFKNIESSLKKDIPDLRVIRLPDTQSITHEITHLTRLAHRDFEFSNIYIQRQTNKILIEGFRSLDEAIQTVGISIYRSLQNIEYVSYEILSEASSQSESLRDQIAKIDVQNEVLDGQSRNAQYQTTKIHEQGDAISKQTEILSENTRVLRDIRKNLNEK